MRQPQRRNLRLLIGFNIFTYGSGFALLLLTFFAYVLGLGQSDGKFGNAEAGMLFGPMWLLSAIGSCGCWGLWRLKQWGVACYIFVWLGFQIHAHRLGLFFPHAITFTWSEILALSVFYLIQYGIPFFSVWHFWKRRRLFSAGLPFESQHF